MKKYISLMRLDHWIKQVFVVPGIIVALMLLKVGFSNELLKNIVLGFFSTCFIASANYVINEWLDAKFDKYHPVKKNRSVVQNNLKALYIYLMYGTLSIIGFGLAFFVSKIVLFLEIWLFVMGILYNVKPFRLKDLPFIDALVESVNNAIRFLIGWFIVTSSYFPPISIVIGYWMAGAFLMETKRYAEYKMIGDAKIASKYRKSFKYYSEVSLLLMSFFYAMASVFFIGVFLIKYKVELLLFIPFYIGLFCLYFAMSFNKDSSAQKPEKLYREKGLMAYLLFLVVLFVVLMNINIDLLKPFVNNDLIEIKESE